MGSLIRRATYDLTGLPPSAADLEHFTADSTPQAYERLIDRLLASPRYGERRGRHWLDVARYSDSVNDAVNYRASVTPGHRPTATGLLLR